MNWRQVTDQLKQSRTALRIADVLGRGQGRLRFLDGINPPPPPRVRPALDDWEDRELSVVWLGHATMLIRIGGRTILTDPVFSNRVGIGLGLITAGPTRKVAAALSIRDLPPIDLILLSHAHFDHLDRPSLARLSRRAAVVTASRTSDLVRDLGYRQVHEIGWGERIALHGLQLTARQVRHWGARTFYDSYRGYNAYLIESASRRILYGGDSAYQEFFTDIEGVDAAIIGIGAYDPYRAAHATPEEAWAMALQARAERMIPMHHSTFQLSHEPTEEPMQRLLAIAGKQANRVVIREVGESWTLVPPAAGDAAACLSHGAEGT